MKFSFVAYLFLLIVCFHNVLLAQNQNAPEPFVVEHQSILEARKHHVGWIFSYAGGTGTTGRDALMFSTFYSFSPEKWYDIEASFHYLGRSWYGEFLGPVRLYASSVTLDAAVMMRVGEEPILRNLRFGIGPSVHFLQYVRNSTTLTPPFIEYAVYSTNTLVGGTVKLEYQIPLSERFDVGVRGQFNLYALEFQGSLGGVGFEDNRRAGFAGLGVYFRMNF